MLSLFFRVIFSLQSSLLFFIFLNIYRLERGLQERGETFSIGQQDRDLSMFCQFQNKKIKSSCCSVILESPSTCSEDCSQTFHSPTSLYNLFSQQWLFMHFRTDFTHLCFNFIMIIGFFFFFTAFTFPVSSMSLRTDIKISPTAPDMDMLIPKSVST